MISFRGFCNRDLIPEVDQDGPAPAIRSALPAEPERQKPHQAQARTFLDVVRMVGVIDFVERE